MMIGEIVVAIFSTLSVIAWSVALFAFVKVHRANRESYEIAKKIVERMEAAITLQQVGRLLKEGKMFKAMDEVGMTSDWVDDMTLEEARQVFAVRVADLQKKAKG
jgi:biopolymer transport protein ExbB/TolQ